MDVKTAFHLSSYFLVDSKL